MHGRGRDLTHFPGFCFAVERVADQRRLIAAVRVWLSYARSVPLYRGLPVCEYSACHHLRASMTFQSIALPIQLCIFSHS